MKSKAKESHWSQNSKCLATEDENLEGLQADHQDFVWREGKANFYVDLGKGAYFSQGTFFLTATETTFLFI